MSLLLALLLLPPAHADEGQQPAWTLMMPLGVPQYAQKRLAPGLTFGALQGVGLGVTTWSTLRMRAAAEEQRIDDELRLRMVSLIGVGFTSGAWFGSVVDGARYYELQGKQMASSALAWRASVAPAEGG